MVYYAGTVPVADLKWTAESLHWFKHPLEANGVYRGWQRPFYWSGRQSSFQIFKFIPSLPHPPPPLFYSPQNNREWRVCIWFNHFCIWFNRSRETSAVVSSQKITQDFLFQVHAIPPSPSPFVHSPQYKKKEKKKRSQIHLWGSPSNFTTGSGSSWTESVKDGVEWATDIDIKCASGVGATGAGCAG